MKTVMLAAALCVASGAWADTSGVLTGPSFSVDYTTDTHCVQIGCPNEPPPHIDGDTVLWPIDYSIHVHFYQDHPRGIIQAAFDFTPTPGLAIASYDVQFFVSFATATYTYDGTEFGHPFPAGTVKGSEGTFGSANGVEHFDYLRRGAATVIEHFNAANPLRLDARTYIDPYFVACPFADQARCAFDWFDGPLDATLTVSEIRITPNIVAVPEPATYALMLAGLVVFLGARRKQAIRTC